MKKNNNDSNKDNINNNLITNHSAVQTGNPRAWILSKRIDCVFVKFQLFIYLFMLEYVSMVLSDFQWIDFDYCFFM